MSGEAARKSRESGLAEKLGEMSMLWRAPRTPEAPRGILVLIVGPSGAGKDTLIDGARSHFRGNPSILFMSRIITRADQIGEKHIIITADEFVRRLKEGGFFLAWEAHGLKYGISIDCRYALMSGKTVIVNVSRQIIPTARKLWPDTRVIYVDASKEVRKQRLIARRRESADSINARLDRAQIFDAPSGDWVSLLDNSGSLDEGIARFNALISEAISASAESAAGS